MNRKKEADVLDESFKEISYADGALELETPEDGATIENPPNGGLRAWLIVLSCTGINILLSIVFVLIRLCLVVDDESSFVMYKDTGIDRDTLKEVSDQFLNLPDVYAPFAAILMIFLGYRPTVCIGAGVVMATLFFLSYLGDDDTEHFITFLIYGPTAVGISFIRLTALIPVLEYFTTKRMKALFLSRLGLYIGEIILLGYLLIPNIPKVTFKWRVSLRASSALCIGIGLIGLTLKDLKLKMKDDETATFVQRTIGLAKKNILRNILLWTTCVVYLFYQWGIEPAQAQLLDPEMTGRLNLSNSIAKALLFAFKEPIGMGIGMFLAWMFKKVALEDESRLHCVTLINSHLNFVFVILIVNAITMGAGCFIAPHAVNFGYLFTFGLMYGAFFAFCEGMRDDVIPFQFGRDNIRIVEGLIMMSAGLGGVITNEISAEVDNEKDDGWRNVFRYGGGMLMFSAIVTAVILYLKLSNVLDQITSKLNGNSVSPLAKHSRQAGGIGVEQQTKTQTNANIKDNRRKGGKNDSDMQQTHGANRSNEQEQKQFPNQTQEIVQPVSMYDL